MDVFETYINSIAYKFPKGYPDLQDSNDVLLLESLISATLGTEFKLNEEEMKKGFEFLSPEAQKIANFVAKELGIGVEDIKSSSKNRIIILSDDRKGTFNKLERLGYERDSNIPGSSQGGVRTENNIEIIIKPKSKQGAQSAGKQNEASFYDLINNHVGENGGPITVIFKSGAKSVKYKNVEQCIDSSVEGATDFQKSDAQLLDSSGKVVANISLKKKNAVRWESSKRRNIGGVDVFKSFVDKALKNKFKNVGLYPVEGKEDKYRLYNPKTNVYISKVIITNTPDDVLENVVFGNDNPPTVVLKEDFENFSNYTFEKGILTVDIYKIYTQIEDLIGTDDEPVFAFSNHIGQAYGVEFRSFSKGLLYKDDSLRGSSEEIDFNKLK